MATTIEDDETPFFSSSSQPMGMFTGDISGTGNQSNKNELSTLNEPVLDTIKRDLGAVLRKFGYAVIPRESATLLQQWDLWGPLILVTILAILLQSSSTKVSSGVEFAQVFTLMLMGSIAVTVNSQLLGGKISFFQSVCVLGYCLLPLLLAAIINNILLYISSKSTIPILHIIRFLIVMAAFGWAMYASTRFLGQTQQPSRRLLVLYPIFLFYFLIAWLIILHAHPK
ncbi:unnamed protein product [Rotaria magnacalcarata]|uniref:Protein YIPF n=3 Tax=Rotaria magnacalcarata TaxID=392030 RepID=A0A816SEY4_9BILA|nr:unnamed protein product [Rotaria magnacalcarata]CAF1606454.1 unnamed protein product [Rotaria magnacalcarata]CAF2040158.1 unnamed protein product [Rotaria magnacalcarata]CAF2084215.1 unnamed protein product [Rotaria magnacalcarata]CAF2117681.1 unnamed protein product [Rotaria magnacalcarata]